MVLSLLDAEDLVHTRIQHLVAGLADKGIVLTEWDTLLYSRHSVPLVNTNFSFLVDDDLLETACKFTEEQGFPPSENRPLLVKHLGKLETIARHFDSAWQQRVNLYPRSFAGFEAYELYPTPLKLDNTNYLNRLKPVSVLTANLAPVVACLVRLISQTPYTDRMALQLRNRLSDVVTYSLFDNSYEGDYMELDSGSDEEEAEERRKAVEAYRTWEGWRDDEMWIADAVEAIIAGKGGYRHLPYAPALR